jgi:hypothetical protein
LVKEKPEAHTITLKLSAGLMWSAASLAVHVTSVVPSGKTAVMPVL